MQVRFHEAPCVSEGFVARHAGWAKAGSEGHRIAERPSADVGEAAPIHLQCGVSEMVDGANLRRGGEHRAQFEGRGRRALAAASAAAGVGHRPRALCCSQAGPQGKPLGEQDRRAVRAQRVPTRAAEIGARQAGINWSVEHGRSKRRRRLSQHRERPCGSAKKRPLVAQAGEKLLGAADAADGSSSRQ